MKTMCSFIIVLLLAGCVCTNNLDSRLNQDFLNDMGSENNKLAGDLWLDYFNEDLSGLTYDYYLTFITKHESPAAKGFSAIIKDADYHYFKAKKDLFVVALYYKKENKIICDNSDTPKLDSVKAYGVNDTIPELSVFAEKWLNR
ncbi:MAG: hypothetical protein HY964_10265 [Ignavibacteriales bacterium]|nr:hypothetical protein [Ignavibacteriales bacterium]